MSSKPAFRVTLALCQRRLEAQLGARIAWLLASMTAAAFVVVAAVVADTLTLDSVVGDGLRWLCWLGAGPTALVAAASPAMRDRRDGIETLSRLHGVAAAELRSARTVAAMWACTKRIALPGTVMALLIVALSPAPSTAVRALFLVAIASLVGAVIGWLAARCGQWAGEHGALLLSAIVMLPWIVADLWPIPNLSLPSLVDMSFKVAAG